MAIPYNPSEYTTTNKPLSLIGKPDSARTAYYDRVYNKWRAFISEAEALEYFSTEGSKDFAMSVIINSGGVYSSGIITGGVDYEYWFRQGVLEKKNISTWSVSNNIQGYYSVGDVIYGIIDQYTGEAIELKRYTKSGILPAIDNVLYFLIGGVIYERVLTDSGVDVRWFGAKGDTEFFTSGGIVSGSSVLTRVGANFNDSYIGKIITVALARNAGSGWIVELPATVVAVLSPTQLQLSTPATATAVSVPFNIGTNDTASIQKAFNTDKNVLLPSGLVFKLNSQLTNNGSYRNIVADGATIVRNCDHISINSSFCGNFIIQGGRWVCPYANIDAHNTGLGGVTFRNNRCNDAAYQFLWIEGSPEQGIGSTRCVGLRVEGCIIKNLYRDGIYTDYSVKLKYINNTLSNVKDDCISIHDYGAGDRGYPTGGYIDYEINLLPNGNSNVTFRSGTWDSDVFTPGDNAPVNIAMTCIFTDNIQQVITFPAGTNELTVERYVNDPELFRILSISPSSVSGVPISFKGKNRVAMRGELLNAGYTQGGQDSIVSGNTVTHVYQGFSSIGTRGVTIINNKFSNTVNNAIIFHNKLGNSTYNLFTDEDYVRDVIISNNLCYRVQWPTYINGMLYDSDDYGGSSRGAITVATEDLTHNIIFTSSNCKSRRIDINNNTVIDCFTNGYVLNNTIDLKVNDNIAIDCNGADGSGNEIDPKVKDSIGNTYEISQCYNHYLLNNKAFDNRVDSGNSPAPKQARGVLIIQGDGYGDLWGINYWKNSGSVNGIEKFGNLSISLVPTFISDTVMQGLITGATYNEANNYTATIVPTSGRKPLKAGFFYKSGNYFYTAISNNTVTRFNLRDLPVLYLPYPSGSPNPIVVDINPAYGIGASVDIMEDLGGGLYQPMAIYPVYDTSNMTATITNGSGSTTDDNLIIRIKP